MLIQWRNPDTGQVVTHPLQLASALSSRDLIRLETITTELGTPVNLGIIDLWTEDISKIKGATKDETRRLRQVDRRNQILWAVNIFATLRAGGEDVTFDYVLDYIKPDQITYLTQPGDDDELTDALDPSRRPGSKAASDRVASKRAAPKATSGRKRATAKR